jgi:hypothetical protein
MVLALIGFAANPAGAATTAVGPYYANPSWDQTLPSSTRFIVLSNMNGEAVLDRETGLVWEQSPSTSTFPWSSNLPLAQTAAAHCNTLRTGGRLGWRLTTIQELASLVDPSVPFPGPTLPSGHPFSNVLGSLYWSATTASRNADDAWVVDFGNGIEFISGYGKSFPLFAWCVRSGQGVDPQ